MENFEIWKDGEDHPEEQLYVKLIEHPYNEDLIALVVVDKNVPHARPGNLILTINKNDLNLGVCGGMNSDHPASYDRDNRVKIRRI